MENDQMVEIVAQVEYTKDKYRKAKRIPKAKRTPEEQALMLVDFSKGPNPVLTTSDKRVRRVYKNCIITVYSDGTVELADPIVEVEEDEGTDPGMTEGGEDTGEGSDAEEGQDITPEEKAAQLIEDAKTSKE